MPLADLAPYSLSDHQWNPAGQGILDTAFPFSITQLDQNTSEQVLLWATDNEDQVLACLLISTCNCRAHTPAT